MCQHVFTLFAQVPPVLSHSCDFSNQLLYLEVTDFSETHCLPTSQLFSDVCPKTSRNFKALCTGELGLSQSGLRLCYKGSLFHRIVPNGWVQGGGTMERISLQSCIMGFRGACLNSIEMQQKYEAWQGIRCSFML